MKKWQTVRRMTPKQKGEVLERLGDKYWLAKYHAYVVLRQSSGGLSNYCLRRCPHCSYIDIWHTRPAPSQTVKCEECGEFSVTSRREYGA